jgi:hypothetical protein
MRIETIDIRDDVRAADFDDPIDLFEVDSLQRFIVQNQQLSVVGKRTRNQMTNRRETVFFFVLQNRERS